MIKQAQQVCRNPSALNGVQRDSLEHRSIFSMALLWLSAATICLHGFVAEASEVTVLKLTSPMPHQVVQRTGTDPAAGNAEIRVRGEVPNGAERAMWEFRVVTLEGAAGRGTDWAKLDVKVQDSAFESTVRVAAGGWYRLEVRGRVSTDSVMFSTVEPIGVGELFVVAGQSYATNCNDERFKVAEPHGRVVAFDSVKGTWGIAHDPQPTSDGSDGGSIWPPLGDALAKELRVPIGFANVAVGGTSSHQWMPDGQLHARLVKTGKTLGRFRAVLWQQGESDVIAKTTVAKYVENLKSIRETAAKAWGFEPPWLLAKSTLHPTVYNDPTGEARIRGAIDELVKLPGFRPGPDTDTLAGENRGDAKSRRHFSGIGQRRAAEMWLAVIRGELAAAPRDMSSSAARSTQALFVSNDGQFKRYRIPSLLVTKKGTLLAICEGRVDGGGLTGNIDLVLRRSVDAGRTWQPLQTIADLGNDTLGNPCPVVDRETGTIWLPFTRSPGQFTESQIVAGQSSGPTTVWVIRSDDDGATWSEPRDISATARQEKWGWYGTGPGIGIQLANGRLLIPSYHTEPGSGMYRSHAIFSDDHGTTWKLGETVGENTAECQAIERRDGTVVFNMRGTKKQGFRSVAISRDGGQTWSEPQLDRNLPEPGCQASLFALPSQDDQSRWLFCNPPGSTRRNLTLRLSRDEGQSWPIAKPIDAGPTEYSCLAWLPDGQIGLLYELSRAGQTYRPELHFVRIPTSWLDDFTSSEPFVSNSNSSAKATRGQTLMFVDDHDVLHRSGTERVLQPAKRLTEKGVISQTKPWEVAIGWTSVHRDVATGKYQLWYQAYAGKRAGDKRLECVVCYAESDDGANFVKPEFDLFPFKEHAKTNIVLIGNGGYGDRYCNSVLVDPREPNPAHKYKMAYYDWSMKDGREEAGLHVAFSADGIRWTKNSDAPLYCTSYGGRGQQPRFADESPYFETPQTGKPYRKTWMYPLSMSFWTSRAECSSSMPRCEWTRRTAEPLGSTGLAGSRAATL